MSTNTHVEKKWLNVTLTDIIIYKHTLILSSNCNNVIINICMIRRCRLSLSSIEVFDYVNSKKSYSERWTSWIPVINW